MSEAQQPTLVQKLTAEVLGTFVLVFFGCSTVLATKIAHGSLAAVDYVAIALAFGLTVLAMAYAVGHISGGHFNPAVSLGAAVSGRLSWKDFGLYSAAQAAGAVLAGLVLFLTVVLFDIADKFSSAGDDFTDEVDVSSSDLLAGVSTLWDNGGDLAWLGAILLEVVATFVFLFVILSVTDGRRAKQGIPAPVAIGLTLTLIHLALIGFTGSSVNPARSLGTALFGGWDGALEQQWVYLIAPFLGAALAGLVYPLVYGRDADPVPGSGIKLPEKSAVAGGGAAWGTGAATAQSEYPGWKWDAATQQWVADPATAAPAAAEPVASTGAAAVQTEYPGWKWDAAAQQWVADPSTAEGDATQIRPSDS